MAHLWAKWLRHPCRLGDPHRCRAGGKIRSGPLVGKVVTSPLPSRGSPPLQSGGEITSGPLVGKVATSPLPSRGSPPLQSGGQNQKWPTYGQKGYATLAVSGIPTASERWAKSEVSHLWAKWLRHPCRLGDTHRCRAGEGNQKWPTYGQGGYVTLAVSGIPTRFRGGGQNQKWPTYGQSGYITLAVSGIPTRFRAGGKIRSGPLMGKVATSPLPSRGSPPLQSGGGGKSEVAHLWAKWLRHPCRLGDPHRFGAGGKIRSGPLMGKVAMSPLPSRGSPPLQSGGQNQKWPTCGQGGYVTPSVSGIPTASERGAKSEVAHLWAKWLCHPCHLGDPHRFRAGGGEIRSRPLMGKVATSPLPSRGSPPLQSGGQNQKWPTYGQSGYVTPAVSGIPTASERGAKSEVAHLWAKWLCHPCRLGDPHRCRAGGGESEVAHLLPRWLRHPCRLGDPHRCRAGGEIRSGQLVGKVATSPLPSRGSPPLQSGGQNQKWPTYGQSGYVTLAVSGIPTAAERGGQNQKWPTCKQSGYVTRAVSGIPTASERGGKSEGAHLWAKWLCHPCRLGDPHRFRAGGEIRSGPLVGKVATSPLPCRGSPLLQSGGQNQKWPTCGQGGYVTAAVSGIPTASERGGNHNWPTYGQSGYVTPAVSGIPTASERGAKSEVAHLWARWLCHPCRLGDPHRCTAGGKIRSGPLVGKVAMSPLPSRGSPPLQSGGQNQKWPTCGQRGYVTPAVSGIPTAAQRGAKSEVAHLWAKWLCHPCRLGDPHRCRAGGKIRSGPLVGNVATSPLPSRGSPPLQSGGAKSEVAPL